MHNILRKLFSGEKKQSPSIVVPTDQTTKASLNPRKAKLLLADIIEKMDDVSIEKCTRFLLRELELLRELANGYPKAPISASVWSDGVELTKVCDQMADLLQNKGLITQAEMAARLSCGMVCQVMCHYPGEVFPRVYRHSQILEGLGDLSAASGGYKSIIGDSKQLGLLDEGDREIGDCDDVTALKIVLDAAKRLSVIFPQENDEFQKIIRKIDATLNRLRFKV
jgi:hypothetical protein